MLTTTATLDAPGLASLLLVAGLGFRHGFDADHIAVVDGMTRARQWHRAYWPARLVGLQFALGHSLVILAAGLLLFGQRWALPGWLDGLGSVVSIAFLLFIAGSNLVHALGRHSAGSVAPMGLFGQVLFRLTGTQLPPALVGMAFALSLDSMGQAAFFATQASQPGSAFTGLGGVLLMAAVFGAGMCVADATNGLLLSWFAQRSDRLAQQASRWSSGFIACIALATVAATLVRSALPGFDRAWAGAGIWVGLGVVALTSLVYALGLARARRPGH